MNPSPPGLAVPGGALHPLLVLEYWWLHSTATAADLDASDRPELTTFASKDTW